MVLVTRILEAYEGRLDQIVIHDMAEGHRGCYTAGALLFKVGELAQLIRAALPSAQSDDAEQIIGIYLHAGCAYVIALLAVLHAGAVVMPLDPQWPQGKLRSAVQRAHVSLILWADTAVLGLGPVPDGSCGALEVPGHILCPSLVPVWSGSDRGALMRKAVAKSRPGSSVAYVMLTSGSTGQPRAVRGTLEGILNRCEWQQRFSPLRPSDVVCFHTAPTFVDSLWQVLGPLLAGARMVALAPDLARNPRTLVQALEQQSVTHFVGVPTLLAAMMRHVQAREGTSGLPMLDVLVSSGEPLTLQLLRQLDRVLPTKTFIMNLYGSTEVAADCTWFDARHWLHYPAEASGAWPGMPQYLADVGHYTASHLPEGGHADPGGSATAGSGIAGEAAPYAAVGRSRSSSKAASEEGEGHVPAGLPIDGLAVFIAVPLQREEGERSAKEASCALSVGSFEVLAPGELGEVCVAGVGVADGYHRADGAAQGRFCSVPVSSLMEASPRVMWGEQQVTSLQAVSPKERIRVFRTGDLGRLSCQGLLLAGRLDLQAKIGGVRVDLTEVEACLAGHRLVGAAAAKVWQSQTGGQLCAYVELSGTSAVSQPPPGLEHELQELCRERLLAAAVPSTVTVLRHLPRSSAGKVQRGALPAPDQAVAAEQEDQDAEQGPASTDPCEGFGGTEGATMRAFQAALELRGRSLEPSTNFWRAGGDSLAASLVAGWLEVDPDLLTVYPTPRSLAAAMRRGEGRTGGPAGSHSKRPGRPASMEASPATVGREARTPRAELPHHDKRPRLLGVSQAAPVRQGGEGPDQAVYPPEPSLGGWVLERSGQVRVCPPAEASAEPRAQQGSAAGTGARWDGCASLLQQRAWGSSSAADGGHTEAEERQLELHWRVKLRECVDAPPLVLIAPVLAPEGASEAHDRAAARWFAFGCSHGGDVVCIDGHSGQLVWRTRLEERANTGMALTGDLQHLAVGLSTGQLAFLRTGSGAVSGVRDGAGRTPPIADPWLGLIWTVSQQRQLLVCKAPGEVVQSLLLPAAASAPLAFDMSQKRAYAALLDGSLVACAVDTGAMGQGGGALSVAWTQCPGAPLFAAPAVLPATRDVVVADVQGGVTCLSAAAGEVMWKASLGTSVYTSPCVLGQLHDGAQVVFGSQDGRLHSLDGSTGRLLWSRPAAHSCSASTGASVRMSVTAWGSGFGCSAVLAGQVGMQNSRAVSCASNGAVAVLDVQDNGGCAVGAACQLGSDVYCAPVAFGLFVLCGCRDDHLYCLRMATKMGRGCLGNASNSKVHVP